MPRCLTFSQVTNNNHMTLYNVIPEKKPSPNILVEKSWYFIVCFLSMRRDAFKCTVSTSTAEIGLRRGISREKMDCGGDSRG